MESNDTEQAGGRRVGRPLGLGLSVAILAAVVLGLCLSAHVRSFGALLVILVVGGSVLSTVLAACARGLRIAPRKLLELYVTEAASLCFYLFFLLAVLPVIAFELLGALVWCFFLALVYASGLFLYQWLDGRPHPAASEPWIIVAVLVGAAAFLVFHHWVAARAKGREQSFWDFLIGVRERGLDWIASRFS